LIAVRAVDEGVNDLLKLNVDLLIVSVHQVDDFIS
jgi:hypothetical protein